MGLLDRLRRRKDLTRDWVRDTRIELVLDLDSNTFNGARLGGSIHDVSFLGPAHMDRTQSRYAFCDSGVVIETRSCGGEEIESIFVVPRPDEHFQDVEAYTGWIRFGRKKLSVSDLSNEAQVLATFGQPTERDEDDVETVLFYDTGPVRREIELTPEGRVKTVAIFSLHDQENE